MSSENRNTGEIDTLISPELNLKEVVTELTLEFLRYEKALVENNVAVLDELFWNHEKVVRYGASENLYGYDAIRKFRASRSSKNLDRTLQNTVLNTFGRNFGVVSTEFVKSDSSRVGRQTQTWVRTDLGWKIVGAHVSNLEV